MAESGLSLGYADFKTACAHFLGYDPDNLSTKQLAEIERYIKSGYNRFLNCPRVPGEVTKHEWNFLSPETTLTFVIGTGDYDAPDGFGGLIGDMTHQTTGVNRNPIKVVSEGRIRDHRVRAAMSAKPYWVAIIPKSNDGTTGQRYEYRFYPTPSAADVVDYRYNAASTPLSTSKPYPVGGYRHGETVQAFILAAAELGRMRVKGSMHQDAIECLVSSVDTDRKMNKKHLGRTVSQAGGTVQFNRTSLVTYTGITPPE